MFTKGNYVMKKLNAMLILILIFLASIAEVTADKKRTIVDSDDHYVKYQNGIVYDQRTNLEWIVGIDKDTHWNEAKSWAESLILDGGGWRMPTKKEVKKLYKKGAGSRNMTFLFNTNGWWIWSEEKNGSKGSRFFGIPSSYSSWYHLGFSNDRRAFAVRSRR